VIPVTLPPLRERKEDIPLLAEHLLGLFRAEMQKPLEGVSTEALEVLMAYDWPGNIRELRNVLERGAVLAKGSILTPMELEITLPTPSERSAPTVPTDSLRDAERRHVAAVLKQHKWNISRSARALGIDRVTLYNKIKGYQIREEE
jgi:two-component system response regulator AtoC